jgi:hypothetical protein
MNEKLEAAYEELREIIDGGSESFTHADAVQYLKDILAEREQMIKAGADIHAGDGGYSIGTRENYEAFVKVRNESLNLEQGEPVVKYSDIFSDGGLDPRNKFDTTSQQRKPLTDEQINDLAIARVNGNKSVNWLARAIEAAHGIKE